MLVWQSKENLPSLLLKITYNGNAMKKNELFTGLHHASLIIADLPQAINFYCHILGLEQDYQRPRMTFEGAWINVGEQQIHLLVLPQTEQAINQPEHVGRDRHLALHVTQLSIIQEKLMQNNISFTLSHSGREALFCRDPEGNGLEFIQHSEPL